ncbi:hypothetical protein TNCV_63861 [Trichonephila clavipes]|nr:hypothetical protein TNCV_63861 [Trichonephila clavipes]
MLPLHADGLSFRLEDLTSDFITPPSETICATARVQDGMNHWDIETGWSAQRISRHLGSSDFTVRRCGNQCTRKRSVTQRSVSGRHQQNNSP